MLLRNRAIIGKARRILGQTTVRRDSSSLYGQPTSTSTSSCNSTSNGRSTTVTSLFDIAAIRSTAKEGSFVNSSSGAAKQPSSHLNSSAIQQPAQSSPSPSPLPLPLPRPLPQQGGKNILPLPLVLNPMTKTLLPIIGNVSYLAIASGFIMTDMLDLRVLLIGGYTGLVAFHTLHERPLRIPLRWSGLFVLLNAGAAAMLVADRYAPSLNSVKPPLFQDDGEDLYQQHFASMLTRGQCRQLFQLADRQQIPAGTILTKENVPCEKMFFLVKGQAHVYHGKTNVGTEKEDDHGDSLADTNNYHHNSLSESNVSSPRNSWFSSNSSSSSSTTTTTTTTTTSSSSSNGGSRTRPVPGSVPLPPHYTHNIATIELGGFINDVAFQQEQQQQPLQKQKTLGPVRVGAYGTVITTEDCDVLVWDTAELRQHMASRPDMDKNMKYCLSHHLVKSLMRQREAAHKRQQEHWLRHLQPQPQPQQQQL